MCVGRSPWNWFAPERGWPPELAVRQDWLLGGTGWPCNWLFVGLAGRGTSR